MVTGVGSSYLRTEPEMLNVLKDLKGFSTAIVCFSVLPIGLLCLKRMRSAKPLFLILSCFSLAVIVLLMMHTRLIDKLNTTKELAQIINREKTGAQIDRRQLRVIR